MRIVAPTLAFAGAVLCASTALAEGSMGEGGATGERIDFPCEGCIVRTPPGYDPSTPTPMLVTFHGDEGDPDYIHWSYESHADAAGFILLSLKCPRDTGCDLTDGSWWMWEGSAGHDPTWAGLQVDAVEAEYNVELMQVYLSGFSGGSSYISNYGPEHSERFAGLVYLGGGFAPWDGQCRATCQIPAYFLIGTEDFLIDGARELSDHLTMCGHEVVHDEVPGVDHTIISDRLPQVMSFLAERPHPCREEPPGPDPDPPPDPDPGDDDDDDDDGDPGGDDDDDAGDDDDDATDEGGEDGPMEPDGPGAAGDDSLPDAYGEPDTAGCRAAAPAPPGLALALIALLIVRRRERDITPVQ